MQWTPGGWVVKDNSHKVTTTMKPLPQRGIIPAVSTTYPEAAADEEKVKMLRNNVGMMQFELNKICRKFRIINFNKDDLESYPMEQRDRLKTAVECVANAEKTLNEFIDYLKEEKYKEWNDQQQKEHDDAIKAMIGETPTMGVPHKKREDSEYEGGGEQSVQNE